MKEQIKQILDSANKIVAELEELEKSEFKGKLYEDTRRSLVARLSQLSNNLVSAFPPALSDVEYKKASRKSRLIRQSLIKIKKKLRRKRKQKKQPTGEIEMRKPNSYVTFSTLLFRNLSRKFISKSYLKGLATEIRKSNINILADSFVAVIIMNVFVSLFAGLLFAVLFSFMTFEFTPIPLLGFSAFDLGRFASGGMLITLFFVVTTFVFSLYYPKLEAMSRVNRINDEIPFATMHMSAIVGSGVEPARVFWLISETPEYKNFNVETRRVVNKINFYGYDLLTAIKETAIITPSNKARDLFNGMASIISTGGDLKVYLEKKANALMVDYKQKRERFTTAAGVYADIYTGLLITAPIVFGVLLTLIAPMGINVFGLDTKSLAIIGLSAISLFNAAFVVLLNIIQPAE